MASADDAALGRSLRQEVQHQRHIGCGVRRAVARLELEVLQAAVVVDVEALEHFLPQKFIDFFLVTKQMQSDSIFIK